jgi:hypothetical protein
MPELEISWASEEREELGEEEKEQEEEPEAEKEKEPADEREEEPQEQEEKEPEGEHELYLCENEELDCYSSHIKIIAVRYLILK